MDISIVKDMFSQLMTEGLGFDLNDSNLSGTPARVARMYCDEFFKNVGIEFTDYKSFPNDHNYKEIIVFPPISFISTCSHHFLPFYGTAYVAYIPSYSLIGASKPARLVQHYAARPQLQENLCKEVIGAFNKNIKPDGCMVVMKAVHMCMISRGVKQPDNGGMVTSAIRGRFKIDSVKQEALKLMGLT